MFEQSVVPSDRIRRPWTIGAALLVQALLVGLLIVIPLMYVQVLPIPELSSALPLVAPPPAPPPPYKSRR
jgi:hypothetical protein